MGALSNAMLDLVRFGKVPTREALAEFIDGSVHLDADHAVVTAAIEAEGPLRTRLVSMLASSVFTAYNLGLEEVTDQHEVDFHRSHAEHLGA